MLRLLVLLLGALSSRRLAPAGPARVPPGVTYGRPGVGSEPAEAVPPWLGPGDGRPPAGWPAEPGRVLRPHRPPPRRRRLPRWVSWGVGVLVVGLIFRRAISAVVLVALSSALHFLGFNVHLPHVRFAWPWQTVTAGTTTDSQLGPWVLQKIEGISKPALGTETFNFVFTHKVSKNLGPWPCWYSSTFYAVGHASATVNLNPGPSWWTAPAGHYRLRVVSPPQPGRPGHVTVSMVLPPPLLPQSAHDVTIDDTLSQPLDTQHSWTYPGLGCGALIKPQFAESVLYAQAQNLAFSRVTHMPAVTRPLVGAAESEASQMIRNNFIQPTVNAFGYTVDSFTLRWATR